MVMADMSATAKVGKDLKSDTMYALYEEWYGGKGGWKIIISVSSYPSSAIIQSVHSFERGTVNQLYVHQQFSIRV